MNPKIHLIAIHLLLATLASKAQWDRGNQSLRDFMAFCDMGNTEAAASISATWQNQGIKKFGEAYLAFRKNKPSEATNLLNQFDKKSETALVVWLKGKLLETTNKRDEAFNTYSAGLKRHPNSGALRTELAVFHITNKKYAQALSELEEAIKQEPDYALSYYWAAKLLSQTPEKLWALLYAEYFVNLERNTDRTNEMSVLMYDTYKEVFTQKPDTAVYVQLTKMWGLKTESSGTLIKPKERPIFEQIATELYSNASFRKSFTLSDLEYYRKQFMQQWTELKHQKEFPVPLFAYWSLLEENGYATSYHYWLFQEAEPNEMGTWLNKNRKAFDAFLEWFIKNPLPLTQKSKTSRLHYWN